MCTISHPGKPLEVGKGSAADFSKPETMVNEDNIEPSNPLTSEQDAPRLGSSRNVLFLLGTVKVQETLQNAKDAGLNHIFRQSMPLARATLSDYSPITTGAVNNKNLSLTARLDNRPSKLSA